MNEQSKGGEDGPRGPVLKNLPAKPVDTGSIPGGKTPCRWAAEPVSRSYGRLEPTLCGARSRLGENPLLTAGEQLPLTAAGKAHRQK